jgi:4'-phosphopantetheinyl transferase
MENLYSVLSIDERVRANRFRLQRDRDHFVVARGLLRVVLSLYLGVAPAHVGFCYGAHGKPRLAPPLDGSGLSFNVSHASGLALYAVAMDRRVGIDLERICTGFAYQPVAERHFSRRERAMLASLPSEGAGRRAFFNCWTRKEALVKAMGGGLSVPLNQFTVSAEPGEPVVLLEMSGDRGERCGWSLHELLPGAGFVGALAVEGHGWALSCWDCPEWILTGIVSVEKGMSAS